MSAVGWRAVVVAGQSMTPSLRPGDCLLVRTRARIRIGDVVLARRPRVVKSDGSEPQLLLVKRVARHAGSGWWLTSDNAELGLDDSRVFGAVTDADVLGKVVLRYYPWRRR